MESLQINETTFLMEKEERDLLQTSIAIANMLDLPVKVGIRGSIYAKADFTVEINFIVMRTASDILTSTGPILYLHCDYREHGMFVKKFHLHGTKLRDSKKILKLLQQKINEEVYLSGKESC